MHVRPLIVASHPRSGTHLAIDFIRRNFPACGSWKLPGEPVSHAYLSVDGLMRAGNPTSTWAAQWILRRSARPLVKSHLLPDYTRPFMPDLYPGLLDANIRRLLDEHGTFLYMVRDGRDVMCSYQLFAMGFDETARCSLGEFLRTKIKGRSRVGIWANHVRQWMARPGTTVLRFEDIIADVASTRSTLEAVIGEPTIRHSPILPAPFDSRAQVRRARLFSVRPRATTTIGRQPGQTRPDWREALSGKDLRFFEREAGDVLEVLRYASLD